MNRSLEVLIALTAVVTSVPIIAATWLVILAVLGRPVFFVQHRTGRGGTPLRLIKFRTMSDARDRSGALLPDTERETRVTRLIRRLRFDELPQIFVILAGRMALVGPRPLLPETIAAFGPAGKVRGTVRPGLTGWAQVSGNTALTADEKLQLDLWYVAHRSLGLDLRIMAETVGVALLGERRRPDRLARAARWLANQPNAREVRP
jgi:lipopolysaccharide/colanic/teichoic acid biosynthesis glycosyltransferase